MKTSTILLIIGGAGAVYFLTRKPSAKPPTTTTTGPIRGGVVNQGQSTVDDDPNGQSFGVPDVSFEVDNPSGVRRGST